MPPSTNAPKMKLKLNTGTGSQSDANPSQTPATPATPVPQTPGGTIKLNLGGNAFKKPNPPASAASSKPPQIQQPKRQPSKKAAANAAAAAAAASTASPVNPKKRPRDEEAGEKPGSASKKSRKGSTASGVLRLSKGAPPNKQQRKGSMIKLSVSQPPTPITPSLPSAIKLKAKGKPPKRELGVGYDSEADEAEEDPALEENFVLRMLPGDDAEYLRNAVEQRLVGESLVKNGADVSFRFWDNDGRRAVVNVRGRKYAAILVDLPCIIESMKSFDKKGWYKSADICQMLLVLGKIKTDEEAKTYALPKELEAESWRWPHGLTPPMHNVRRRRFRERTNIHDVELAETELEKVLAADEAAVKQGGKFNWELIDEDDDQQMSDEEDMDGDSRFGDEDTTMFDDGDEEDGFGDADEIARRLEAQLADHGDDEDELAIVSTPAAGDFGPSMVESPAAAAGTPTAMAATPSAEAAMESVEVGEDDSAVARTDDDEATGDEVEEAEEESSTDDDDESEESDDEAREKAQYLVQQREEIAHLEQELQSQKETLQKTTNSLLKSKVLNKIKALEGDLEVKRRVIGEGDED